LRSLFKFLSFVLLILGAVFWLRSDFWRVKKIDCHLNGDPCPANLWAELMNQAGEKNILLLSPSKLSEQITENHPEFFQVEIKKQLPQDLLVGIQVRRAVVAIGQEEGDFYLVDNEGVLLAKSKDTASLPKILIANEPDQNIGEKIKEEILLKEIQILHGSQLRLLEPKSSKTVSERIIEVRFKDGLQVLFSTQKEIKSQLDSLQFILERTKIEGEKPKRIDLRFDKPIISSD